MGLSKLTESEIKAVWRDATRRQMDVCMVGGEVDDVLYEQNEDFIEEQASLISACIHELKNRTKAGN
jgi:predicted nucleotidyltransferase